MSDILTVKKFLIESRNSAFCAEDKLLWKRIAFLQDKLEYYENTYKEEALHYFSKEILERHMYCEDMTDSVARIIVVLYDPLWLLINEEK